MVWGVGSGAGSPSTGQKPRAPSSVGLERCALRFWPSPRAPAPCALVWGIVAACPQARKGWPRSLLALSARPPRAHWAANFTIAQ
eukprot:3652162-Pyramimonas_sp.AAC.1